MITAAKGSTVEEVLKLLVEKDILSVPVFDESQNKFLGMFDRQDLVSMLLSMLDDSKDPEDLEKDLASMPVEKAINKSLIDVFFSLSGTMSVNHLIEEFTRGLHRTTVKDEDETICNIVSQSDVARYVVSKYATLDTVSKRALNTPLSNLGLRKQKVVTIEKSKPTVEGFRLIDETKVDALAVVDEEGHLCGTLSASDLRGLGTDMFARLKLPVAEFLEKQDKNVIAKYEDSVKEVIEQILQTGVHRLWVLDEDGKPDNVISLTNVMKALIRAGDHIENPKEKRKSLIMPLQHASPPSSPPQSPSQSPPQSPPDSPRSQSPKKVKKKASKSPSPRKSRSSSKSSSPTSSPTGSPPKDRSKSRRSKKSRSKASLGESGKEKEEAN